MSGTTCSVCGAAFTCNNEQAERACWCAGYPAIIPADFKQDCCCRLCLARVITEHIETAIETNSHEQMLEMAGRFQGDGNLIEHIDYTIDNGKYVFSTWYHLKRGTCCGNNCRNCPFPAQSGH